MKTIQIARFLRLLAHRLIARLNSKLFGAIRANINGLVSNGHPSYPPDKPIASHSTSYPWNAGFSGIAITSSSWLRRDVVKTGIGQTMESVFGREISRSRILCGIKTSKEMIFTTNRYASRKPVLECHYAQNARGIIRSGASLVANVGGYIDIPEIGNTIVVRNAVDVVDYIIRPLSVDVEPSQPVRGILNVIDADSAAPFLSEGSTSNGIQFNALPSLQPSKFAGIWIVMKQFAKAFCRKKFLLYTTDSHDDSSKVGLVGARISRQTMCGLAHFTWNV